MMGLVQVAATPKWTVDDAFITFRYAHNLAMHGELNWNVGEDPVEGYTGVAWPVMMAAAIRLGVSPVVASQVLGVICWFAGARILERILSSVGVSKILRAVIILLFLGAPFMAVHALGGLETQLYSTAALACLWSLTRAIRRNRVDEDAWLIFCFALLVGLIRPEGVVAGAVVFAIGFFALRHRDHRLPSGFVRKFAMYYLFPGACYFAVRWQYYGQFFPNAFHVKNQETWNTLEQFDRFVLFLKYHAWPPAIVCAALGAAAFRRFRANQAASTWETAGSSRVALAAFCLVCGLNWCGLYLRTDPVMNFSYRYYVPIFAMILCLTGLVLQIGWESLVQVEQRGWIRPLVVAAAAAFASVEQAALLRHEQVEQLRHAMNYKQMIEDEHERAGRFLQSRVMPSELLAVHVDAGAIPYFSGCRTLDLGRLNNEQLAGRKLSDEEWADFFFANDPAAAVFSSYDPYRLDHGRWPSGDAVTSDPRFRRYVLAASFTSPASPNYRQLVYLKAEDSDAAVAIDESGAGLAQP